VTRWEQIHRDYPLRALLGGWLLLRWLRALRWARYALGRSGRRWVWENTRCDAHLGGAPSPKGAPHIVG